MATKKAKAKRGTGASGVRVEMAAERDRPVGPTRWRGARGEEVVEERDDDAVPRSRLRGGLRALYESGAISQEAYDAATRWRRDFELGVHGATDPEKRGGGPDSCYQTARHAALTRWRTASAAIGDEGVALMRLFAFECIGFAEASRILRAARDGRAWAWAALDADEQPIYESLPIDREVLRARTVQAVEALAAHYAEQDRARRLASLLRREVRDEMAAQAA